MLANHWLITVLSLSLSDLTTNFGNGSLGGTLGIIAIKNEYKDENRVSTIYVDT